MAKTTTASSSNIKAQSVGTIKELIGTATATDASGTARTLHTGDKVYANEIIQTSAADTVQIEFANANFATVGHGSSLALDKTVFDPNAKSGHESDGSLAKAKAKIAAGADPTEVTDPSAAGPAAGGDDGQGAHSAVFVQQNAASGNLSPTTEFETSSAIKALAATSGDEFVRANTPPVAEPATNQATEDGKPVSGNVVATDFDGDTLTYSLVGEAPAGLTFNSDGSYTFDPTSALAHAAYDNMAAGDTKIITVEYSVSDGNGGTDTSTLTITLTGTNDAATIETVGQEDLSVIEAGGVGNSLIGDHNAGGSLVVNDVDHDENHFATATGDYAGTYGSFHFDASTGAWTYVLDNDLATTQALIAGQQITDTLTVTSHDGTASYDITVDITGANDTAVITGTTSGSVTEAGGQFNTSHLFDGFTNGKLQVADVDTGEAHFHPVAGSYPTILGTQIIASTYGTFTFNASTGNWTYSISNSSSATQSLAAGEAAQDKLTVTSHDGTSQTITVDITGSNDNAFITNSGSQDRSVTEAGGASNGTAGDPLAGGKLNVTDVDHDQNHLEIPANLNGTYGSFSVAADGTWTYTLNNDLSTTQALTANQHVTDSITVRSHDGTASYAINVNITGTNDHASITGTSSGSVTEAGGTNNGTAGDNYANGKLTVTDVDAGQNHFEIPASLAGKYGSFTFQADGTWTYTLNDSNADTQALAAGQAATDTLSVTSHDGTATQVITVNITGANDAPVAQSSTVAVAEDGVAVAGPVASATDGAALVLTVDVTEPGQAFSFDWQFQANDYLPFNDFAFVQIDGHPVSTLSNVASVGNYGHSGLQSFSYEFATPGSYQVVIGVSNVSDVLNASSLVIKNLSVNVSAADSVGSASESGGNWTLTASGADHGTLLDLLGQPSGQLLATDVDHGANLSFAINGTAPDGFTLNTNGSWTFNPAHATYQSLAAGEDMPIIIGYTVSDGNGGTDTGMLTITITGTNDVPVIQASSIGGDSGASPYTILIEENTTTVTQVVATDADSDSITYSLSNGADAAFFNIDPDTGKITFKTAPDYENPQDAGGDNHYNVVVTASDKLSSSSHAVTIQVTDRDESIAYDDKATVSSGTLPAQNLGATLHDTSQVAGQAETLNNFSSNITFSQPSWSGVQYGAASSWISNSTAETAVANGKLILTDSFGPLGQLSPTNVASSSFHVTNGQTLSFDVSDISLNGNGSFSWTLHKLDGNNSWSQQGSAHDVATNGSVTLSGLDTGEYRIVYSLLDKDLDFNSVTASIDNLALTPSSQMLYDFSTASLPGWSGSGTVSDGELRISDNNSAAGNSTSATTPSIHITQGQTLTFDADIDLATRSQGGTTTKDTFNWTIEQLVNGNWAATSHTGTYAGSADSKDYSISVDNLLTGDYRIVFTIDDRTSGQSGHPTAYIDNIELTTVSTLQTQDIAILTSDLGTLTFASPISGNLINNDHLGAPEAALSAIAFNGTVYTDSNSDGIIQITGDHGLLTVYTQDYAGSDHLAGDYVYAPTQALEGGADIFHYTLTQSNGDHSDASLTLSVANASLPDGSAYQTHAGDYTGTENADYIFGSNSSDVLHGAGGNDYLSGGEGNDTLQGGSGNDHLLGGAGNDILNGGAGHDILVGGAGSDIFQFTEAGSANLDYIADFKVADSALHTPAGDGDILDVSALLNGATASNIEGGGFLHFTVNTDGTVTLGIDSNGGGDNYQAVATMAMTGITLTSGTSSADILSQLLGHGEIKFQP